MKTHALAVFHRPPEGLNCAQAVLAAYQHVTEDRRIPLADFNPLGGGHAPGGRCGALHAACALAPAYADAIEKAFVARIGARDCADISRPCRECVGTAAGLLDAARRRA